MRMLDDGRVIAGCIIGGFVGGIAIATTWTFKPEKDFWDILSSVGTMSAVFVALAIALTDGRRRKNDERTRARLVAASMALPLALTIAEIDIVVRWLDMVRQTDTGLDDYEKHRRHLDAVSLTISREQLTDLSSLRNDCAYNIVVSIAQLDLVKAHMRAYHSLFLTGAPAAERRNALEFLHGTLAPVSMMLGRAMIECQKAQLQITEPYKAR